MSECLQPLIHYSGVVADEDHIPADVALLLAFANTLDERSFTRHGVTHVGGDELATTAGAQQWLARHRLLTADVPLGPGELAELLGLRDGLRWALATKAGARADAATLADISAALGQIPLVLNFGERGQPQLTPVRRGPAAATALLAAKIAVTAVRGNWQRLRMCAASDCRWVFYDTSRRGGGRWCSMAVCGNRIKTRRYRQKLAQPAPG